MNDVPPILVVDDEPLIRLSILEALLEGGYTVLEASDGHSAIEQIDRTEHLRGIVTDVRMGNGPEGWTIAHHARKKFPAIAVVYVTGDSFSEWSANGVPQSTVLQKPLLTRNWVTALANLLVAQQQQPNPPASRT